MIGPFRHDHLRQQTGARSALLNGLHRLPRRSDRAITGIFAAHILNHLHRSGNVFVALAGLFFDQPQVPAAAIAVLFRFCQIVYDPFPDQIPRQHLTSTPLRRCVGPRCPSCAASSISASSCSSLWLCGCCACHAASNNASCSLVSCSLSRLRCASSNSRSRFWYLFCSASERSSCAARSTTIFYQLQAGRSGSDLFFGFEQGKSHRLVCYNHFRQR